MKSRLWLTLLACMFACLFVCMMCVAVSVTTSAQDKAPEKGKDAGPKLTDEEGKQVDKMNKATTVAEKTKLGIEFIKKFKKNTDYRAKVAGYLATQIFSEKDPNLKIQAAQQFIGAFDQPGEAEQVKPALIDGYVTTGKFDEAFTEGGKYMEAHPEEVFVAASLGLYGTTQMQKMMQQQQPAASWKWAKATLEYQAKAIELLEQDKKPEQTGKEEWTTYRNSMLPRLYQAQGAIHYSNKELGKARESLEKAFGIDQNDIFTLNYLVGVTVDEYQELAQRYQTEKKNELYEKAVAKMDEAIDFLARGVALTDGDANKTAINTDFKDRLKQYYEFRNPGKAADMQALVDKYKKK